MSNHLTSRDFLEIVMECLECHGQITIDHDYALYAEALNCLKNENFSACAEIQADTIEVDDEEIEFGVPFAKGAYENLSSSEKENFLSDIIADKSQGIVQIPVEMVRNCYLKEMGQNCDDTTALKIASQVARDFDYHKSAHQQVMEACQSAEDENMLALLSI